ncbi:MAG: hypothetical protein QHH07_06215 [Sedimentisphaerales bacterium]|nr:hypothetical protein [Sedimentisphaerales bacterium]
MILLVSLLLGHLRAQDQQWLQYRIADRKTGWTPEFRDWQIELQANRPQGVRLPKFKHSNPCFGRWKTPLSEGGFRWFALDRSRANRPYYLLYIDSNGDGHLDDEQVIKGQTGVDSAGFWPVRVTLKGHEGAVTYHMIIQVIWRMGQQPLCLVRSGCWYEGQVKIDERMVNCILLDYTANGTFDDASLDPENADKIIIGEQGTRSAAVGRLVDVNGVFYELQVAREGGSIRLRKPTDLRFGSIKVPSGLTMLTIAGLNGQFYLKPQDRICQAPVGTYGLYGWQIEQKNEKGKVWSATGSFQGQKRPTIELTDGRQVDLDIQGPLVSRLEVRRASSGYVIGHVLEGQLGEQVTLMVDSSRPRPPKLRIWNQQRTFGEVFNFAYG